MKQGSRVSLSVTPEACISAALMLIMIPLPWLAAWFLAAAVHELCHCLALFACRKEIYGIQLTVDGAQIHTQNLSDFETLLCAAAGPSAGLLLFLTSGIFPKVAVCAFIQSAFNLLPVYPLDGGRALLGLLNLLLSPSIAYKVFISVESLVCVCLLALGFLASFVWHLGFMPVIFAVLLLVRIVKIKIPCK